MGELIKVTDVKVLPEFCLLLTFNTGEKKQFDAKPFLQKGIFKQLNDEVLFSKAKISARTVTWETSGQDFDIAPNTLYQCSNLIENIAL